MRYYLDRYVGAGSDDDPFRPSAGTGPSWDAIDLRPDSTRPDGFCLVAVPSALRGKAGRVDLGDDLDAPSPTARRAIESRLGLTFDDPRGLRHLVAELLLEHGRHDGTRWRPLESEHQYTRIFLGGEPIWSQPVMAGGAVAVETFDRADGPTIGPLITWTKVLGAWTIVGNRLNALDATQSRIRAEVDVGSANMWAQVEDWNNLNVANTPGVLIRYASAADTAYLYRHRHDGTDSSLRKIVAATSTVLATTAPGPNGGAGKLLRCSANGSTLAGALAGVTEVTVTDTAITGNQRAGLSSLANAGSRNQFDNFQAAPISPRSAGGAEMSSVGIGERSFGSVV